MSAQIETKTNNRRIFLGCMACYNNGRLIGEWLDLDDYTLEEMEARAKEIVDKSPCLDGEEYDIQDYEGFGNLLGGFSPSLIKAYAIHDALDIAEDIAENEGIDPDLFLAFLDVEGYDDLIMDHPKQAIDRYRDKYAGTFDTLENWAVEHLQDTGAMENIPEYFQNYFDYQSYARDAELNGDIYSIGLNGETHVFYSNA